MRTVEILPTFESWQQAARALLREEIPPASVAWCERSAGSPGEAPALPEAPTLAQAPALSEARTLPEAPSLPEPPAGSPGGASAVPEPPPAGAARVPRRFLDLARAAATHRDPDRWELLYTLLWRLVHDERDLLTVPGDPQVRRLVAMAAAARRAAAGMEARAAPAIAHDTGGTPEGEGAPELRRGDSPPELRRESSAGRFVPAGAGPLAPTGAGPFVPIGVGLAELAAAAARCTGCDLYRHASRTVFGQGPADARVVLVGEQPGDQEDLRGAPFVGPAGEVLDRALGEAGLDRTRLYVTNAVKHFKFVARGKRRIHQTPQAVEIAACRPWLEAEIAVIRPAVLVCLGATAARALLGPGFRLLRERGRFFPTRWAPRTLATLHPSAVLRGDDEAAQARLYAMLLEDLRLVAAA
jgi:uracil-DNA glycosylase family protein